MRLGRKLLATILATAMLSSIMVPAISAYEEPSSDFVVAMPVVEVTEEDTSVEDASEVSMAMQSFGLSTMSVENVATITTAANVTTNYTSLSTALNNAGSGDTITLLESCSTGIAVSLPADTTLKVPAGITLTISSGYFTNRGTIVNSGVITCTSYGLVNYGSIENSGELDFDATLTNNGSDAPWIYSTLSVALTNSSASRTVTLLDNVVLSSTITISKATTLDLNGYTISSNISSPTNSSVIFISASGLDVTIKNGKIQAKTEQNALYTYKANTVYLDKLTVNGYTIALAVSSSVSGNSVDVKITDCSIVTSTSGSYGIYLFGDANVVVGGASTVSGDYYGIITPAGYSPSITIEGTASISGPSSAGIWINGSKDASNPATLTVSGGTISGVFGISGNGSNDYTNITISGGTVKSENYCAIFHPQVGDLTITGGEIIGYDSGIQFSGEGTFLMTGGTVRGTADMELSKPSSQSSGSVLGGGAGLLILSRGSGYQDNLADLTATIEGGIISSTYGSPIIVCRVIKIDTDNDNTTDTWVFDEETGISSYLDSLTITGGTFVGIDEIAIDPAAADVIYISGGSYTTAPDDAFIDSGYKSKLIDALYCVVDEDVFFVTFDAGMGYCEETTLLTDDDGQLNPLPVASYTGFTFQGWYLDGGDQFTATSVATADTTVSARYAYDGNTTVDTVAKYGNSGTVDLSLWATLPGAALGTLSVTDAENILDSYSLDGSALSFAFKNDIYAVGDDATIIVPVTSDYFQSFDVTVTLTATAKDIPTVSATGLSKIYDSVAVTDGDIVTTNTQDGSWAIDSFSVKDVGVYPYQAVFTPTDGSTYETITLDVVVTITPATATITVDNTSAYRGYSQPTYSYTVSGLLGDDTLTTEPSFADLSANMSTNGTYSITASGADADGNYIFTYVDGTLTITSAPSSSNSGTSSSSTSVVDDTTETTTETTTDGDVTTETTVTTTENDDGSTTTVTASTDTNEATGQVTETVETETVTDTSTTVTTQSVTTTADGDVTTEYTTVLSDTETTTEITATVTTENGETTDASLVAIATEDSTQVVIPQTVLETIAAEAESTITVQTAEIEIVLDETATNTVATALSDTQEDQLIITAVKVDETVVDQAYTDDLDNLLVVDLTITVGDKTVSDLGGGTATVTIPYTKSNEDAPIVVYYVTDDGTITPVSNFSYDPVNQLIVFITSHFSYYMVSENTAVAFTDVAIGTYYYDAVKFAVENGITDGVTETSFAPDEDCTRAQIVTFLYRAAGQPEVEGENPFADMDSDAYYYNAVLWAVANGITTGTSETEFSPDATCTRAQVATFLYRMAGQPEVTGETNFTDMDGDAYYCDAVLWAVANGITTGTSSTTFAPEECCTRSQVVTFIYRYMSE